MNKAFEKILERLEIYEYNNLIEHNEELSEHCKKTDCDSVVDCSVCIMDKAISIVQEIAEEYDNGWFPCSVRLPDIELEKERNERGSDAVFPVLATINKVNISGEKYTTVNRAFYGCYNNDKNFYNACCDKLDVIAWQPLPEPYQPKGE